MTRHIAGLMTIGGIVAAVAALYLLVADPGPVAAATFNPSLTARYCNSLPADFPSSVAFNDPELLGNPSCADPGPIAPSTGYDLTVTTTFPATRSLAGSPQFTFLSGTIDSLPNGTKVGGAQTAGTYGLLNGPCTTSLTSDWTLYSSSLYGTVSPSAEGTANRFAPLATDSNADGLADASSPFIGSDVDIYPPLFDPDLDYLGGPNGGAPPITPIARYSAMTRVPLASDWQLLSIFVFQPNDFAGFASDPDNAPHPFSRASRSALDGSYVLVTVFDDPLATFSSPSVITDRCAPLSMKTMLKGVTSGGTRALSPPDGTWGISHWSYSGRDEDGDGIENRLDTCPFVADAGVDTDSDGIDSACDPTPGVNTGFGDHDGDGFPNRGDNCPLVYNSAQADSENQATYILAAPDGGPKTDGIGDACDPNDFAAATEGYYVEDYNLAVKCIGVPDTDADNDGYCAASDIDDMNATVKGFTLNKGPDIEYQTGRLGDGWGSNAEIYMGTNPLSSCGFTPGGPSESWPADLWGSNSINVSDSQALQPLMGSQVTTPAQARYDLAPSKTIDISDLNALQPVFGTSCIPGGGHPFPPPEDAPDADGDGVPDATDNCPTTPNPGQEDTPDGDLIGNACDPDDDSDGVADGSDNCPQKYNPDQGNQDGDGLGNACDPDYDSDGDGIPNATDNCPDVSNPGQANLDGDSFGDACDSDIDGDGDPNNEDNCPSVSNASQTDTDGDGLGDACDPSPNDADSDDDGVNDGDDNCPSVPNANQADADGDGLGDVCDPFPSDADGDDDGVNDASDNCPAAFNADQLNVAGDAAGDACDPDIDGDGTANAADNCARVAGAQTDTDGDGLGDICDPNPASSDADGDTIPDAVDTYPAGADGDGDGDNDNLDNCPTVANADQFDADTDGLGDVCDPNDADTDTDNDTVLDGDDNCVEAANSNQADADSDGVGAVCDPNDGDKDSDSDSVTDGGDNCQAAYNPFQRDIDGDHSGDACDSDVDGDGDLNAVDNCLFVSNASQSDSDGDGAGDACDPFPTAPDGDADGVPDPVDNCKTAPNPQQADADKDRLGDVCDPDDANTDTDDDAIIDGFDNCVSAANSDQTDTDSDGEGDACDPDDDNDGVLDGPDNCEVVANPSQEDNEGDGLGDACDPDDDNDSFLDTVEPPCGSNPLVNASIPERGDTPGDDDGDGQINEPLPPGSEVADCDGDGFSGNVETSVGTFPNDPCGYTPGAPAESETWPPDLVESNSVNVSDVLTLKPVFGTAVPPTSSRYDIAPSASINVSDVLALKPVFGTACVP